jgi:hypothetical protein
MTRGVFYNQIGETSQREEIQDNRYTLNCFYIFKCNISYVRDIDCFIIRNVFIACVYICNWLYKEWLYYNTGHNRQMKL